MVSRPTRDLLAPLIALVGLGLSGARSSDAAPPPQRGIALGLFAEDPSFDYSPLLKEIAATGATHVSVVIPYYQRDIWATSIGPHPRFSPPLTTVHRTLRQARAAGLKVVVFPILRVQVAATPDEWRGALAPKDLDAWWRSYEAFILDMAQVAARHRAAALCVGSELGTMDGDPTRWRPLLQRVRRVFSGALLYSANWDRYDKVGLWPLVDLAGLSAYFQLTDGRRRPDLQRLIHAWREQRVAISRWRAQIEKPLVITEVGYHSQIRTSAQPWNESADKPVSLTAQADCIQAFARVWEGVDYLQGVYFWNWFGWGGPKSREYTPRGKPAAKVICDYYGAPPDACPRAYGMPWFDMDK